MNIREHLSIENSKKNWEQVVDYVGNDAKRFDELMQVFLNDERFLIQRSSQPVGKIGELHPRLITLYFAALVDYLETKPIDAVKRNVMRIFQFLETTKYRKILYMRKKYLVTTEQKYL